MQAPIDGDRKQRRVKFGSYAVAQPNAKQTSLKSSLKNLPPGDTHEESLDCGGSHRGIASHCSSARCPNARRVFRRRRRPELDVNTTILGQNVSPVTGW